MYVHISVKVVDPLPYGKISRAAFIGMSWQKCVAAFPGWQGFQGAAIEILRKNSNSHKFCTSMVIEYNR